MATLIRVDGSETEVHPKNGKTISLEELQMRVCGIAHNDFVVGDVVVCNPVEAGDGE
jgi:hypothetical protein